MSPVSPKTPSSANPRAASSPSTGNRTEVRVEFDRHIVSVLGDEHYPDADYLFTELAANAYDADATEVRFDYRFSDEAGRYGGYKLEVRDNGLGMDVDGLRRYFTFGASTKPDKVTAKGRRPIGRFGLGKVSALKAASHWYLETEHRGKRYFVDVDFERWMEHPEIGGFTVEPRKATGETGTRIELVGVHVEGFREDRIVRAIRRLPLGRDFKVYVNKRLIPARAWDGIEHHAIDISVPVGETGRVERIEGAIWIHDGPLPIEGSRKEDRPSEELKTVLDEDLDQAAGVEVKVNGATVAREFFGRERHAHGVNWIWGYARADWLPVLANRTDYVRDSEEGLAFYNAMAAKFGEIYTPWRKQVDLREEREAKTKGKKAAKASTKKHVVDLDAKTIQKAEKVLSDVGGRIQSLFETEPTRTPFLGPAPDPRPGRPSETRIRPLYEFKVVDARLGSEDEEGEATDFELKTHKGPPVTTLEPVPKRGRRRASFRPETTAGEAVGGVPRRTIQPISNIPLRMEMTGDRPSDSPFRWSRDPREGHVLHVNANYPLHRAVVGHVGSEGHRLYLAFVVALALAERRWPAIERQRIADYVLELMNVSAPRNP